MAVRVGINGFGRIGRNVLRAALGRSNLQVVAINDLTDTETNAHLLKHDSNYGHFKGKVEIGENDITVEGKKTRYGVGDEFKRAAGCRHVEDIGPQAERYIVGSWPK